MWNRPARPDRRLVVGAGVLIVAHVAFRAWVAFGGYFYSDDYRLVAEAKPGLDVGYLLAPYDAQFMPFGRLLAWVAAQPEQMSWPLLAASSLLMATAAALACLWMLVTLFGWRRRMLVVLALYLTTAMTLPAFSWWAAAINQLPLHAAFFLAVGAWVRHLRGGDRRWVALTFAALVFALACYVKALLIFPVLAFVTLAYFTSGGPARRARTVLREHGVSVVAAVGVGGAFLAYYLVHVPRIATGDSADGPGALAGEMIGRSFVVALLGGPWRWDDRNPPVGQADPPAWLVTASWLLVVVVVAYLALRRERTGRAWALLVAYVAADYVLLLTSRATVVGSAIGTEYRYLTDAMCAVVLAVALATMELRGATESSEERRTPLLTVAVPRPAVAAMLVAVVGSGLWSSARYAHLWHDEHRGKAFFTTAVSSLQQEAEATGQPRIDLSLQYVPAAGGIDPHYVRTDVLLPLLTTHAAFPDASESLHMLASDGTVRPVALPSQGESPPGPVEGCGWRLPSAAERSLALSRSFADATWWLRVDYLASNDSGLTVSAGDATREVSLRRGLHQVYVRVEGAFDQVRLAGVDAGATVCVDKVVVGQPVPEEGS